MLIVDKFQPRRGRLSPFPEDKVDVAWTISLGKTAHKRPVIALCDKVAREALVVTFPIVLAGLIHLILRELFL